MFREVSFYSIRTPSTFDDKEWSVLTKLPISDLVYQAIHFPEMCKPFRISEVLLHLQGYGEVDFPNLAIRCHLVRQF